MGVKEQYRDYVMTGFVKRVEPVVAERGDGAFLYDADGTEYIDCFAGISVTNAGHHNEKVLGAALAQAEKLVHACSYVYHVPTVGALAEKLAEVTPGGLQKTFFGNGGAEAIEGAFRLAKRYSGRREFLAIESSFHGRSFATLSVTGNSGRKKGGGPYMPGVAYVPTPYCYRCFAESTPDKCDLLCARRVAEIARLHLSGDVCAFIAEPVLGEGGIIVPPEGYFKRVKETLDEMGILFICDEVQTGFGRTGKLFGIEHYGVEPDIMTLAKGIADGWPLSAFIARPEIADAFQVGDHLSTFGGNPVSCAAALANIEFLTGGVIDEAARKGEALMARFRELQRTQPLIGEVRGKGLMIGVELVTDQATKAYGTAQAGFVRQYCLEHGLLIGVGGNFGSVLRIQPPLVIDDAQLERVFATVADGLEAAAGAA
ncbi:MAG TPA: aspartate aminotransferase family protein [Thermoleophilia bacterium]|nr:aspartate aminotransferase family protein [Acidobacteriota bacterium]OPZ45536.1 MAG: Putrescine aminotransferase [Actinobacteria bacterium ADurb.BinA094]HQG04565.1 aspartate aminotransferase family protein [Thermoleophilia bacterium]HQH21504.1 aspartate aminotransferase family protein [Thermoleophilia bacterium]